MLSTGRILMILGGSLFLLGGIFILAYRLGLQFGHLPGDLRFGDERFSCFIPLGTSVILSILLTIVINLILKILNR